MNGSQRMICASLTAVLACVGVERGRAFSAEAALSLRQRFLEEAPQQWESYRQRAARFQGSYSAKSVILAPAPEVLFDRQREFKQRGGCALFLEQDLVYRGRQDSVGWLKVVNPRYAFELRRPSATAPWAVTQLEIPPGDVLPFKSPIVDAQFWSTFPLTFVTASDHLPDIVKRPEFSVKEVTGVARDGARLAKVEFEYRLRDIRNKPLRGGWVLLDPERHWVIREFDVRTDWWRGENEPPHAGTLTATYEYREADGSCPILRRFVRRLKVPAESLDREERFEFDIREEDVPESEFILSAFGFPEPPEVKSPVPWYLWAAVAGIACLGGAMLFRVLARRRREAAASP